MSAFRRLAENKKRKYVLGNNGKWCPRSDSNQHFREET
jgi:hypothetical protein